MQRWAAPMLVVLCLLLPGSAAANTDEVADELIVTLHSDAHVEAADVHAKAGGRLKKQLGMRPVQAVKVDPRNSAAVRAAYRRDPRVKAVEPNVRVRAAATSNDPGLALQWGFGQIDVAGAWEISKGMPSTAVAVVDTGVDASHPDLRGQLGAIANFSSAPDAVDRHGHGTHVAGIIAATYNNRVGAVGVAPGVQLLIARALDDQGVGTYADVIEAMNWSVDQGAKVINLSLAGPTHSVALEDAVAYAQSRGALVVAAAGNNGDGSPTYPAAYPGVVSVATTDRADAPAAGTSFGRWVTLGAPGVDVYSTTIGGRYGYLSGSSTAAAHVTGVAAIAASIAPGADPLALRKIVLDAADITAATGSAYEHGRVNARRAAELARERAAVLAPAKGGPWRVNASGTLAGPAARTLSLAIAERADGAIGGSLGYVDRRANLRVRATDFESLNVTPGVAVLKGNVKLDGRADSAFRLIVREAQAGKPAQLSFDLAGQRTYHAEGVFNTTNLRIAGTGRAAPPTAPTRTPVSGDGGGMVQVAAPTGTTYLRDSIVTRGGLDYYQALTSAPDGSATTLTANIKTLGTKNLIRQGVSVFVSPATGANEYWDIGGTAWTFRVWTSASATVATPAAATIRAVFYRVSDVDGIANLIATTDLAPANFQTTTWSESAPWSYTLPAGTLILPNERYGVQFQVHVTSAAVSGGAVNGRLRFDHSTNQSRFTPGIADAPTPTHTATDTPTRTPTATPTATPSPTITLTHTPAVPTNTPTNSATATATPTVTSTATVTNTPVPGYYLLNTNVTVGSTSFKRTSTTAPTGGGNNLSAPLATTGLQNFKDGSNRYMFVAPSAVPAGENWDLAGSWTFNVYVSASQEGASGTIQATLHKIDSTGTAYQLAVSPPGGASAVTTTSWTLVPLSLAVPADTELAAGEYWAVSFQVNVTGSRSGNARLRVGDASLLSRINPVVTEHPHTPTPTLTPTETPTRTLTPTLTPTTDTTCPGTCTFTPTRTPTHTPTSTATASPTNTPVPGHTLHDATVTVGAATFKTVNTLVPSGTLRSVSGSIGFPCPSCPDVVLEDTAALSIFASDAAPANQRWDMTGTWTFVTYTRASATGYTGYIRAKIYRISATGTATLMATTPYTTLDVLGSTTATARTWTYAATPGTIVIDPGERWGVEFEVDVNTVGGAVGTGFLDFDTVAQQSRITPALAQVPGWDRFDRADSMTQVGTGSPGTHNASGFAETGQTWQTDGGKWGVCSMRACLRTPVGGTPDNYVRLRTSALSTNQAATVVIPTGTAWNGYAALALRVGANWDHMTWVGVSASGDVQVWALSNGTWLNGVQAVQSGTIPLPLPNPMVLTALANGTSLSVYVTSATNQAAPAPTPLALSPAYSYPAVPGTANGIAMYVDSTGPTYPEYDDIRIRAWP